MSFNHTLKTFVRTKQAAKVKTCSAGEARRLACLRCKLERLERKAWRNLARAAVVYNKAGAGAEELLRECTRSVVAVQALCDEAGVASTC